MAPSPTMTTSSDAPVADNQASDNIKTAMDGVSIEIMRRQPADFYLADPHYGTGSLLGWAFPSATRRRPMQPNRFEGANGV
jgi:hypothetical protein